MKTLAASISVHPNTVQNFLRGKKLTLLNATKISQALGLSLEECAPYLK